MSRDGHFGHLEGDIAAVSDNFAPILINFSLRLVSGQSLIGWPGLFISGVILGWRV